MRRLLILIVCLVVTLARPETYREKEDFQYSRSSTDEGSKAGFYGAQRGNMGGNYERAHNMDNLAQHQMSGVVRQVEGELGDATNSRRGNVFSAASTRGMYGQGNYDLSNLAGRNFQEGTSLADSQSSSSATASRSAGYTGRSSSYSGSNSRSSSLESHDLQNANYYQIRQPNYGSSYQMQLQNNAQGHRAYEHGTSEQSASEYQSYGQNNYEANSHGSRYITATPARVRPNSGTASSIILQAYDDRQRSQLANAEAEILNNHDSVHTGNRPRHYESSYNYQKEWERHNIVPAGNPSSITTESPNFDTQNENVHEQQSQSNQQRYATNSRLTHNNYGAETQGLQSQEGLSTSHVSGNSRSNNYQSNYDADYNQRQHSSSSVLHSNMYSGGQHSSNLETSQNENQENIDTRPKSYQSSYSYHKSWERQGDPYVIQPASGASANLQALNSDSSANRNVYASHRYGSNQHRQSHQSYTSSHNGNVECDEDGHVRVARSYQSEYEAEQKEQIRNLENQERSGHTGRLESFDQQLQNNDFQDMNQQIQTDFGQQTQDLANLEDLGQQIQTDFGRLEDFGQQTQENFRNLENFGQQIQGGSANLEDLGQQQQTNFQNLEDFGQHTQDSANLMELGQQTQTSFDNLRDFGQHIQGGSANFEDLGQQEQTNFQNFEDVDQHTQNEPPALSDSGQQTQTDFDNLRDFGQHIQGGSANLEDFGQQIQSSSGNLEHFGQHALEPLANLTDVGPQTQLNFGNLETFDQQSQKGFENLENLGQKTQSDLQSFDQQSEDKDNLGQQIQGGFPNLHDSTTEKDLGVLQNFNQETQNRDDITRNNQHDFSKLETMNQQTQKELPNLNNFDQQVQTDDSHERHVQQETQTLFSNIDSLEQKSTKELNSTNLQQERKEDIESNVVGQDADNTLNQVHSTYDHNHLIYIISPTENVENTSQSSSDGDQSRNENNVDTHEHSYYHTSSNNSSNSIHWSYTQVSQSNQHNSSSNHQTNNFHRTSDLDSLWDEIYDLMDQTDLKNNETKESKITQDELNKTQESPFTYGNSVREYVNTSQNNDTNSNTNDQRKPTSVEPARSSNFGRGDIGSDEPPDFGRGDIESDYAPGYYERTNIDSQHLPDIGRSHKEADNFPNVNKFSTERSMAPTVFTNDNPKNSPRTQEKIGTLSLVAESTTMKEYRNEKENDINNQFHELYTNNYRNENYTNIDNNRQVTELQEHGPEEISDENIYSSYNTSNKWFDVSELQSETNRNDFHKDETLNQQIQSTENENLGQYLQTDWNTKEDLVQQIQTAWNPNEIEQQPEDNFQNTNFSVLPHTSHQNIESPVNVSEQYIYREKISNVNNEPGINQDSNNPNDKIDSTTELVHTTLEYATEKPGFWHSIGNKFGSAKNKIVSWFHRS